VPAAVCARSGAASADAWPLLVTLMLALPPFFGYFSASACLAAAADAWPADAGEVMLELMPIIHRCFSAFRASFRHFAILTNPDPSLALPLMSLCLPSRPMRCRCRRAVAGGVRITSPRHATIQPVHRVDGVVRVRRRSTQARCSIVQRAMQNFLPF